MLAPTNLAICGDILKPTVLIGKNPEDINGQSAGN